MNESQKKILFLIVVQFMQTVFLMVPTHGRVMHDFFILSDAQCTLQEYIYYGFEHLAWCYAFFMMYRELDKLAKPLFLFFVLSVIDFVDFILSYNALWGHVFGLPLSFNVVNMIGLLIIFFTTKGDGE